MASYVVFEPPGAAQPESAAFVRDGFHWLAFLVPVFWFLWYRLWIEAGLMFAAMIGLAGLERVEGMEAVVPAVSFLISIGLGFEATTLRMAALRRRGWRERGVVEADNGDDAAIRYLADAEPEVPSTIRPVAPMAASEQVPARRGGAVPALGLFDYPGRH